MSNSLKPGSIWVDNEKGSCHVLCWKFNGKVYATGTEPRPTRYFNKNFSPLKNYSFDIKEEKWYNLDKDKGGLHGKV